MRIRKTCAEGSDEEEQGPWPGRDQDQHQASGAGGVKRRLLAWARPSTLGKFRSLRPGPRACKRNPLEPARVCVMCLDGFEEEEEESGLGLEEA